MFLFEESTGLTLGNFFSQQQLELMAMELLRWSPIISSTDATEEPLIAGTVQRLDAWAIQFRELAGELGADLSGARWNLSSFKMSQASSLKGGAAKVEEAVRRAITLSAPAALAGPSLAMLRNEEDYPHHHQVLLSATSIRRSEFALDLALCLMYMSRHFRFSPITS
jgi:hypothetical protein